MSIEVATSISLLSLYIIRFCVDWLVVSYVGGQWTGALRIGLDFGFMGVALMGSSAVRSDSIVQSPSSLYESWHLSGGDAWLVVMIGLAFYIAAYVLYSIAMRRRAMMNGFDTPARRLIVGNHAIGFLLFMGGILSI
jgi:hypothetical protein